MRRNWAQTAAMAMAVVVAAVAAPVCGHAQAAAAPHQSGTVKAATGSGLTLTTAAGQDYTVTVSAGTKVMVVPPGTAAKDATAGTIADVATGDKAIVLGTAGDTGTALTATKVYLMKSAAIAQSHAASDAAWAQGLGGIVKSVDVSGNKVVLSSRLKTITVVTTPATVVRHYSGDSVSFADAKPAQLSDVKAGDQLRVRGSKAMDGLTITADEMVAGTFHNFSGLVTAVDTAAGTVSLKDLATKKMVTVTVSASSNVKRIAPQMATMIAARMKAPAAGAPGGGAPGGGGGFGGGAPGAGGPGGGGPEGSQRAARGGAADLSQMLGRLPVETLANLKPGEAVMIVASSPADNPAKNSVVTLVVGVDALLTASPTGEMTLSPWSLGSGGGEGGGGGEPGGGR